MKIRIEHGSDFDRILIVSDGDVGRYHVTQKDKEAAWGDFPMPKGNGTLEINING